MHIKNTFPLFILVLCLFTRCNNEADENVINNQVDIVESLDTDTIESNEVITLPSPDEMFSFIKQIGNEGKSTTHLNSINNYHKYVTTQYKALNFGIYATDFLYCSTFDYNIEAVQYFTVVSKLASDLGLAGVINPSISERLKNNVGKNDSLATISNAVYSSSISELEKTDKASSLALVITGGWIESMHLVTHMVQEYDSKNPALIRIAEQKYTLNNLISYLNKYKKEASVAEVIKPLAELKLLYDGLKEEQVSNALNTKNGRKILSGGVNISMNREEYLAIKEKIKNIHDLFIAGK